MYLKTSCIPRESVFNRDIAVCNQPYKNTIKKEPSLAKMEMRLLLPGTAG
jgi:hypothetical protein